MLSKESAIGKTIEKKGFTSSTYDYMAAEEMMFDDSGLNVLIKITGKNGKNIEDASLLPAEREVLFRSNTKFEVESVKFDVSPVDNVSPITRVNIKER